MIRHPLWEFWIQMLGNGPLEGLPRVVLQSVLDALQATTLQLIPAKSLGLSRWEVVAEQPKEGSLPLQAGPQEQPLHESQTSLSSQGETIAHLHLRQWRIPSAADDALLRLAADFLTAPLLALAAHARAHAAEARWHEAQAESARAEALAARLTAECERLEQSSRQKSLFLANMSHDIRTPMNAIIGMAELLSETPLSTDQARYVQIFRSAGDTLLGILDDILDLSKVEAGLLTLESIPLALPELMERCADVMALRAHERGLELLTWIASDVPSQILGDPTRLNQVLTNLLSNAIKFTERGEVTLRVEVLPEASPRLRFSVTDTGIGIPPDKRDMLFHSFTQADPSVTRTHGGTGLGLAIAYRLVQLMGGQLEVESEVGSGSRFFFSIPLTLAALPRSSQRPYPADLTGIRLLVIDDNPTNRLILEEQLRECGAFTVSCSDGPSGLEALRTASRLKRPYHALILDHQMAGMDGLEVARRLLSLGLEPRPSVLLLSSGKSLVARELATLGIDRHLFKPLKRQELLGALQQLLSMHEAGAGGSASQAIPGPMGGNLSGRASSSPPQVLGVERRVSEGSSATASRAERLEPTQLAPVPPPVRTSPAAVPPRSILIAEDTEDNRLLLRFLLKDLPYELELVENWALAVQRAIERSFDLILMDVQMPVMDGITAVRAIRQVERDLRRARVPIVALTAHSFESDVARCLEAGCDAHLPKPIRREALLKLIAQVTTKAAPEPSAPPKLRVPSTLAALIPLFLENRKADVRKLQSLLEEKDTEGIRAIAHVLRGTGGTYGFVRISELGQLLSDAAKAAQWHQVELALDELRHYLEQLEIELT